MEKHQWFVSFPAYMHVLISKDFRELRKVLIGKRFILVVQQTFMSCIG